MMKIALQSYIAVVLIVNGIIAAQAIKVEVDTQVELAEALNDTNVDQIVMADIPGGWIFKDDQLPKGSAWITDGRQVLLEGKGKKHAYLDGNQLNSRVYIDDGGWLIQKNVWVDDCFSATAPYTCFAEVLGNKSRIQLENSIISDASCIHANESLFLQTLAYAITVNGTGSSAIQNIDDRSFLVTDGGWVKYEAVFNNPASEWRYINVTLSCTGGVTHNVPTKPGFGNDTDNTTTAIDSRGGDNDGLSTGELVAAIVVPVVAVAALAGGLVWGMKRRKAGGSSSSSKGVEYEVSEKRGYALDKLLASTEPTQIYKGTKASSKEQVLIKVVTIDTANPPSTLLSTAVPDTPRVLTSYTAVLQHSPNNATSKPHIKEMRDGDGVAALRLEGGNKPAAAVPEEAASSATPSAPHVAAAADGDDGDAIYGAPHDDDATRDLEEGVVEGMVAHGVPLEPPVLQTHTVLGYAGNGSLDDALKKGVVNVDSLL